jgi:hypothetical protein
MYLPILPPEKPVVNDLSSMFSLNPSTSSFMPSRRRAEVVDTMREVSKSSEDDLGPKFDDPSSVMSGVVDEGGVSHIPERKVRFGDQLATALGKRRRDLSLPFA